MRILVDILDDALGKLNSARRISRAELVRSAVPHCLQTNGSDIPDEAFGLWAARKENGLSYQKRLRSEW